MILDQYTGRYNSQDRGKENYIYKEPDKKRMIGSAVNCRMWETDLQNHETGGYQQKLLKGCGEITVMAKRMLHWYFVINKIVTNVMIIEVV